MFLLLIFSGSLSLSLAKYFVVIVVNATFLNVKYLFLCLQKEYTFLNKLCVILFRFVINFRCFV